MNGSKIIGGDEGSIGKLNMNRFNLNYMQKKKNMMGHTRSMAPVSKIQVLEEESCKKLIEAKVPCMLLVAEWRWWMVDVEACWVYWSRSMRALCWFEVKPIVSYDGGMFSMIVLCWRREPHSIFSNREGDCASWRKLLQYAHFCCSKSTP